MRTLVWTEPGKPLRDGDDARIRLRIDPSGEPVRDMFARLFGGHLGLRDPPQFGGATPPLLRIRRL